MLTTKQKLLRHFWYATVPLHDLTSGPKPFRLMNEDIVLFLDADGQPAALKDRCCHRTAKLSNGWCEAGQLVCGYHGWTYNREGRVTAVPQLDESRAVPVHQTPAYHCTARYGYAWVALEDPLVPLFDIPEEADPQYRRIFQFYERWNTAPLRLMENSFDAAHFSFTHRGTFGNQSQPKPSLYTLTETDYGFVADTIVEVVNPPLAHRVTGTTDPYTVRDMHNHWYLPFCRRLDMTYPSGIRHIIIDCATPIDDGSMQLVQLLYRNDTEADCPEQLLIDWDRAVITEDKGMLESTDPDVCIDLSRRVEGHMPSDRPGIIMRRRLLELLREHGEEEVHGGAAAVSDPLDVLALLDAQESAAEAVLQS
jgi:phenylpropionate dioxygenase-like ring-hydroxylating dioxygenase large terminal subunit